MNVFEIDDGEQWWYVAKTKEDALRLHLEPLVRPGTDLSNIYNVDSRDLPCPIDEMEVTQWPPESILIVREEDDTLMEKTAAEWAAEGEGLIACTVY